MKKGKLILAVFVILFFTGCKPKEPELQPYKIQAQIEDGASYDISEVRALTTKPMDMTGKEYLVAKAPIINGNFTLELPAMLDDKFLQSSALYEMMGNITVNNTKSKTGLITEFEVVLNEDSGLGFGLGLTYAAPDNNIGVWTTMFMFTDSDVKITGSY